MIVWLFTRVDKNEASSTYKRTQFDISRRGAARAEKISFREAITKRSFLRTQRLCAKISFSFIFQANSLIAYSLKAFSQRLQLKQIRHFFLSCGTNGLSFRQKRQIQPISLSKGHVSAWHEWC